MLSLTQCWGREALQSMELWYRKGKASWLKIWNKASATGAVIHSQFLELCLQNKACATGAVLLGTGKWKCANLVTSSENRPTISNVHYRKYIKGNMTVFAFTLDCESAAHRGEATK